MNDGVPVIDGAAPELLVDLPTETGEGPLWNDIEQALYWVDIPPGRLYRYDPATGRNDLLHQHDGMIGGFTFQADGSLLLFGDEGRIVRWQDGVVEMVIERVAAEAGGRFNDVAAGPDGQVFCGSMPTAAGTARLYRLELNGDLTLLFDDIGLSNGFGFSPDNRTMYHTDTTGGVIYRLDYEAGTGAVQNRETLVTIPGDEGWPDGMTVDLDGDLWSARWDGHALYRYSASGQSLGKVPFPVRKVSSIAFGGAACDTGYVTTAGGNDRGPAEGDLAGSLFAVNLGVQGRPPFRSRIGL